MAVGVIAVFALSLGFRLRVDAPIPVVAAEAAVASLAIAISVVAAVRIRHRPHPLGVVAIGAGAVAGVLILAGLLGSDVLDATTGATWATVASAGHLLLAAALITAAGASLAATTRGDEDSVVASPVPLVLSAGLVVAGRVHHLVVDPTATELTAAPLLTLVALLASLGAITVAAVEQHRRAVALAVEAERRRMAAELHDGMAHLAFITAQASWLAKRSGADEGPLQDLSEAAAKALAEARRCVRPSPSLPVLGQLSRSPRVRAGATVAAPATMKVLGG